MQIRHRYRIEPTPAQKQVLERVFGCARVVFNDALRVRDEAYRSGVKLSDSEIQRRVITAAKNTEQRAWLCEVPSVALVQSVNDSRRAWRNFFDSNSGKRRGRRVGRPRMKSRKDHRQSFRLARNGFSLNPMAACSSRRSVRSRCAGRGSCPANPLALVRENQVIHVENLDIVGMVKNRRLARAISDAGWGNSCGSSVRRPTATGVPCTRFRGGGRRARRVRHAGTGSTSCRCRYASGRARLARSPTTETTTPPTSYSPPGGRRD